MQHPATQTYECDQCGACCDGTVSASASKRDVKREPRLKPYMTSSVMGGRALLTINWDCSLKRCPFLRFDDNRCDIYETRPYGCRQMPAGGVDCQEARRQRGLPELMAYTPSEESNAPS